MKQGAGMDVIFGLACDGRSYPDFPGERTGALHRAVTGPSGLINLLEVQLGLTAPRNADAVRVAAYAAKIAAALGEADAFFARSFERDAWATATTILNWRDRLKEAGWNGQPIGSPRVDDLARVERLGPTLPDGATDRLCELISELKLRPKLTLQAMRLVEPRDMLPPAYSRLIDAVEACGVAIIPADAPNTRTSGDLGRAQAYLAGSATSALQGDGSLQIVAADTALMAAEAVADWMVAGGEAALAGTVVVCDGDTALLDQALEARGLPALGQSAPSPWRGALQVLPLAFAASWAPFNPKPLLDLLLLPRPPIGRSAARKLARALAKEPGKGGKAWAGAWTEIEAELTERFNDRPEPQSEAQKRLGRWREWTSGSLYDRSEGMPADAARQIAGRVLQWAIETDAGASDPLMLSVAGAASTLVQAIDVLGQERLPALLLERMIEQVLSQGARNPDHVARAGGLRCVTDPAAIWGPVERLVWWNFSGPGARAPSEPWSRAEVEALSRAGCLLEPSSAVTARLGWSYANALHKTRKQALLVRPSLADGEETTSHPLAHQLHPLVRASEGRVVWKAEALLDQAAQEVAQRTLVRETVELQKPPQPRARWALPDKIKDRLTKRRESATSFEHLADCQMRWLLLDVLKLSRGRFAELPGADQLLGNLAHEIASKVFRPGPAPDPRTVRREVEALFDETLTAIAAPLQQPELAGELAAAKARVPAALADLAALLEARRLEVVGTELKREAEFADGLSVVGYLDMVVRHPQDGVGVIDLKWTRSAKRRRTEIAEGRALQLATYGAIADPESPSPAPGAYYLLNQRRLIGLSGSAVAEEIVATQKTLDQTWADLKSTWRQWRDLAKDGSAIATGMAEAQEHMPEDLAIAPSDKPCTYCELTSLCRVTQEAN